MAPLCSPACKDLPAVPAGHAGSETVLVASFSKMGLECPLHLLSMLENDLNF
jgi:hypothetical protein